MQLGVRLGKPGSLSGAEALWAARLLAPLYACPEDEIPNRAALLSPEGIVALWQSATATLVETADRTVVDPLLPPALAEAADLLPYLDPVWVVRLASVLQMKDRAGLVGARGVGPLLGEAVAAAPEVRFHLVGHSYGCKVVLSALCQGPQPAGAKAESLLLLQPAVNYRCFAAVIHLAQAIYRHRLLPSGELDPARVQVLADALEDVGASDEMVRHLRSPQVHVRGCFLRFVDCQYCQLGADDSTSRGQAEPGRQLPSRAGVIPAEGGSLLKHDPTRRRMTTPAEGVQGVKRRTSGTRPLYPV